MRVDVKPLTVNQCWQGRRLKTKEYKNYEQDLLKILTRMEIPEGRLSLKLIFGFSNSQCDWDNPIKPFVDILQKKYGFNDSRIYEAVVKKDVVKKGQEYIGFEINEVKNDGS